MSQTCYQFQGTHYVRNRHVGECDGSECSGCAVCPEGHCAHCTKAPHLEFGVSTCPECLHHVRTSLGKIVHLYAGLPFEAIIKGVNSEAANLHGPFGDPEAFAWRRAAKAKRDDVLLSTLEADDEHHPGGVLKRWIQALCEDYNDDYDRGDDLASMTDWLDSRLHRIANDQGQDFGLFKREIDKVVAHLEAVLHAGEQIERGVHCPDCVVAPNVTARRLVLMRNDGDKTGASDRWTCPMDSAHWWSPADYRNRVGTEHRKHAKHLTASDIAAEYRVPEGTTRRLASGKEATVRKAGYDGQRRQLYNVADVLAHRDMPSPNEQAS